MPLPRPLLAPLLCIACVACRAATPPAASGPELVFVRGGVVVDYRGAGGNSPGDTLDAWAAKYGATPMTDRRWLVTTAWLPGQVMSIGGATATAPRRPECVTAFSVALGDVSASVAMGAPGPDTALAWSPDGTWLAVGSALGEVLLIDGWSGAVRARRRLAESHIKAIAWAPDGQTLYAAEQSPDALVHALDTADLHTDLHTDLQTMWSLRLADRVQTSAPPATGDIYGMYDLPAAYGLEVLPTGELFLTAMHGWTARDGKRRNRSQLLLLSPGGEVLSTWPPQPADAIFQHPRFSEAYDAVVVAVTRSADGPAPADYPYGGVMVLDMPALTPRLSVGNEPLSPYFKRAYVWEALDISTQHDLLMMGLGDGRLRLLSTDGTERATLTPGTPIQSGDVPIHASIGWGIIHGQTVLFNTANTLIPWGAASPELRPPSAHPSERTVFAVTADGAPLWSWLSPLEIQGLTLGQDGQTLVVGGGRRQTDTRRDLYGAALLDLGGDPSRTGSERLITTCSTQGPVFFHHQMTMDGRLALAESPYKDEDGSIQGQYRVTVVR